KMRSGFGSHGAMGNIDGAGNMFGGEGVSRPGINKDDLVALVQQGLEIPRVGFKGELVFVEGDRVHDEDSFFGWFVTAIVVRNRKHPNGYFLPARRRQPVRQTPPMPSAPSRRHKT